MNQQLYYLILTVLAVLQCRGNPLGSSQHECPADCICYSDYLHNLESWRWVEPDIHSNKDDPEHESFNPYTEHNEVYENPKLHRKQQRESLLFTVTCMLRSNETGALDKVFTSIPGHTQVLSLIQAPGSLRVLLERDHLRKFESLVGLEIKGYTNDLDDVTEISGDCFEDLASLTYLNLETVGLQHITLENRVEDSSPKMIRINYTFNDAVTNELTSQVLIIKPDEEGTEGENGVVSYSEYKMSLEKEKVAPMAQTFRVAFSGLPKLQHLRISECNLHDISWDMFYKLDNLKFLFLDENDLLFLPDFVFYATSNLSVLSLSRNRILNLQTVGLAGLLYLQKLDVTYNNITHLSELSLPPFPHLEIADFRYNPIKAIFPNTFEIMNSTKTLYLGSDTAALDLSPNSFFGLTSLTKLDIINVKIRVLEKSMLKGMPQLKTLIMTGDIPKISYDAFGDVGNMEKLIMSHCGIKKISMDAFFGLTRLTELDLSHNVISFLPPGIFEEQVILREVFLQHNQLTTLPTNLIENLPVKILRLEANLWHCSCDMKKWKPQIINRVKRYHIPQPNNTLCQKVYDKGSMCFETYEPKFEVTYSYEKRVSPVCETPFRFNGRSVFQVLRKELRHCTENEKATATANESETIDSRNRQPSQFPDNYSLETLEALEKQLREKPKKIKKPPRPVDIVDPHTNVNTDHDNLQLEIIKQDEDDISNNLNVLGPSITNTEGLGQQSQVGILHTHTPGTNINNFRQMLPAEPPVDEQRQLNSVNQPGGPPLPDDNNGRSWANSKAARQRKKEKKEKKNKDSSSSRGNGRRNSFRTNTEQGQMPTISRKSLKMNQALQNGSL